MMGYIVYQYCSIRKDIEKLRAQLRTIKDETARADINEQIEKK